MVNHFDKIKQNLLKSDRLKNLEGKSNESQTILDKLDELKEKEERLGKLEAAQASDEFLGYCYDKDIDVLADEIWQLKYELWQFLQDPSKVILLQKEKETIDKEIASLKAETDRYNPARPHP